MRNKKMIILFVVLLVAGAVTAFGPWSRPSRPRQTQVKEVTPFLGTIRNTISVTGTVLPKNRLEIKPPVNGRVDSILVEEGQYVKTGQIVAWMSSTDRAALLDAAHGQGEATLKYWQDTYKAIPLIAPIDGQVIVATTQPGQTVTTADAILVLSDQLIVRAQVDETDIGKITPDKKALVTLDAYPGTKIAASVAHIYYESKTVNNVTIYSVDLSPERVPPFFRSGMNAGVDFIDKSKDGVLIIPLEAVQKEKDKNYVMVKSQGGETVKTEVKLGMSDDKNVEVVDGISEDDTLVVKIKKYALPKNTTGTNPFVPNRKKA